jgi:protein-disulfide isomerase
MGFRNSERIGSRILLIFALAAGCLAAQTAASAGDLPGVDFSGLSAAQKATAQKILNEQGCSCGCDMKIGECRVKDPACGYSQGLAAAIVESLKNGGTEQDAIRAAANSKFAHGPSQNTKLLEDPISIPTQGAPVRGPSAAAVTLVEFSDFQCPYCVAAVPQLEALLKAFPTQVKLIFKQYPLDNHSQAAFAAAAALAAQKQGKFWQMHDALFAHHQDLSEPSVLALAKSLGLDMQRFQADLKSPAVEQVVKRDIADGDRAGVPGTPTLYVDGQRLNGPLTLEVLKPVIEAELKQPKAEPKTASVTATH